MKGKQRKNKEKPENKNHPSKEAAFIKGWNVEKYSRTEVVVLKEVHFIVHIPGTNAFIICPARTPAHWGKSQKHKMRLIISTPGLFLPSIVNPVSSNMTHLMWINNICIVRNTQVDLAIVCPAFLCGVRWEWIYNEVHTDTHKHRSWFQLAAGTALKASTTLTAPFTWVRFWKPHLFVNNQHLEGLFTSSASFSV